MHQIFYILRLLQLTFSVSFGLLYFLTFWKLRLQHCESSSECISERKTQDIRLLWIFGLCGTRTPWILWVSREGPDHQGLSPHHSWHWAAPEPGTGHLLGWKQVRGCQSVKKHLALRPGRRTSLGSFSSPQIPSSQLSLKTHTNLFSFPFAHFLFIFGGHITQ